MPLSDLFLFQYSGVRNGVEANLCVFSSSKYTDVYGLKLSLIGIRGGFHERF